MRNPGEIRHALLQAAAVPGTVRDLCERAQVGLGAGRYTASRMRASGELLDLPDAAAVRPGGPGRPAAVVVAADAMDWVQVSDAWDQLDRAFWETPVCIAGED